MPGRPRARARLASFAFVAMVLGGAVSLASGWGHQDPEPPNGSLGESLERSMMQALAARDTEAVAAMIAEGFLSIHEDGARDRAQELALVSKLDLGKYTLSGFREVREGSTIVVCYFLEVEETIDGTRLPKRRAARSSVWSMTPEGWKWIHHANLNALRPQW